MRHKHPKKVRAKKSGRPLSLAMMALKLLGQIKDPRRFLRNAMAALLVGVLVGSMAALAHSYFHF